MFKSGNRGRSFGGCSGGLGPAEAEGGRGAPADTAPYPLEGANWPLDRDAKVGFPPKITSSSFTDAPAAPLSLPPGPRPIMASNKGSLAMNPSEGDSTTIPPF